MLEVNKIYNMDCLDGLKLIDDESVDFICCDLPYGETSNKEDTIIPFDIMWKEFERIIKDNGIIALFGQGLFFCELCCSNKKLYKYDIVWNKVLTSNFLNVQRQPLRQHEQIAIFCKSDTTNQYYPQMHEGEPLHSKGTAYKNKPIKNQNYGNFDAIEDKRRGSTEKYPTTIWTFPKPHPSQAKHRTEKPMSLLGELIKTYSKENDLCLDICCGSNPFPIMCRKLNRNFIGFEKDNDIWKDGQDRMVQEFSQLSFLYE